MRQDTGRGHRGDREVQSRRGRASVRVAGQGAMRSTQIQHLSFLAHALFVVELTGIDTMEPSLFCFRSYWVALAPAPNPEPDARVSTSATPLCRNRARRGVAPPSPLSARLNCGVFVRSWTRGSETPPPVLANMSVGRSRIRRSSRPAPKKERERERESRVACC